MSEAKHTSTFEIPPYFFDSNAEIVRRLEQDDGDMDEISKEIAFRTANGEWLTQEQHDAEICRINPAYAALKGRA